MDLLPEQLLDNWIGYLGPNRRELFGPLRPLLIARPDLPAGYERSVEPAIRLLDAVGRGEVTLDKHHEIKRAVAFRLNGRIGLDEPSPSALEDPMLEVEVLLTMLRGIEATDPLGWKETLSFLGRAYMDDPAALWFSLVGAMGLARPRNIIGDIAETTLAWLLRKDADLEALDPPILEAARTREPDMSDSRLRECCQVGIFWTYTKLRALNLFVPKNENDPSKPALSHVGHAGAIEALRAAAATAFCYEHAHGKYDDC